MPSSLQDAALLRTRAQALARGPELHRAEGSAIEFVEFRLAGERYAVESRWVREVRALEDLLRLPCTPPFIAGLVGVRGRILPVIDLKTFFELPATGISDLHRVLVMQTPALVFGLLSDTVEGRRSLPLAAIQPPLPTLRGVRADYLTGLTADGLAILDVANIAADPRIIVHEEVEDAPAAPPQVVPPASPLQP